MEFDFDDVRRVENLAAKTAIFNQFSQPTRAKMFFRSPYEFAHKSVNARASTTSWK
jgi:hypothetical protein